jgi:hypothetical protein
VNAIETQCAMILNEAKSTAHGLVVRTSDAYRARATFYRVRRMVGDIELSKLQIRVSPDDSEHELWIIRLDAVAPTFNINAENANAQNL